jgi:peptidoglycan-associated lipoprotein
MKKTALALVSALLLLAACDSSSSDTGSANGAGGANGAGAAGGYGTGSGQLADSVGDRVLFDTNSSVINADGQATLDRQAGWLKSNSNVNIVEEGHADERGTREFNLALGERRATAAKNYLVSQGVAASRVSTISYGKERPAVTGNDESAWSQNRRAVTVIAN